MSLVTYRIDKQSRCAQSATGHAMLPTDGGYSCAHCNLAVLS